MYGNPAARLPYQVETALALKSKAFLTAVSEITFERGTKLAYSPPLTFS